MTINSDEMEKGVAEGDDKKTTKSIQDGVADTKTTTTTTTVDDQEEGERRSLSSSPLLREVADLAPPPPTPVVDSRWPLVNESSTSETLTFRYLSDTSSAPIVIRRRSSWVASGIRNRLQAILRRLRRFLRRFRPNRSGRHRRFRNRPEMFGRCCDAGTNDDDDASDREQVVASVVVPVGNGRRVVRVCPDDVTVPRIGGRSQREMYYRAYDRSPRITGKTGKLKVSIRSEAETPFLFDEYPPGMAASFGL